MVVERGRKKRRRSPVTKLSSRMLNLQRNRRKQLKRQRWRMELTWTAQGRKSPGVLTLRVSSCRKGWCPGGGGGGGVLPYLGSMN